VRRLRLLRFLLLATLLPFIVVVVYTFRKPSVGTVDPVRRVPGEVAERIEFVDWLKGVRQLKFIADFGKADENGEYHFENIDPLELYREDGPPLKIRAPRGSLTGSEGQRLVRLEGGVEVEEEVDRMLLKVPALEVNQAAAEARSLGGVEFRSPEYRGQALSVIYSLEDEPTLIHAPELEAMDGSTLRAERARLLDGTRDVVFEGGVRIVDATRELTAETLRVRRREDGSLERTDASGEVHATVEPVRGERSEMIADRAEIHWDDDEEMIDLLLEGRAFLSRGGREITADRIRASRPSSDRPWSSTARGSVVASAATDSGRAVLTCRELNGELDPTGALLGGEALGNVRLESASAVGEASTASFDPGQVGREITLYSSERRRARLAQGRSRVAAETIVTAPDGSYLLAEVRVEASLLPATDEEDGAAEAGLFDTSEAIHFVSKRLEGNPRENRLVFSGSVRGWQGERNLKAERVTLDEARDTLVAEERVSTRLPRADEGFVSEADYIQIAAERLDYRGDEGTATYTGGVRVRQAEGWLESGELVVVLAKDGDGVEEIRAKDQIRFEFRAPDEEGLPRAVTGTGDRVIYLPSERVMILHGDHAPAAVRREGGGGGTTKGRVLRYYLDSGALKVESGERDRAKIQTTESPGN
jgi:lipopolysaccharide transport protein LptA